MAFIKVLYIPRSWVPLLKLEIFNGELIMEKIKIKPQFSVVAHSQDMVELKYGVWNSISHLLNDENKEGILASILLGLQAQLSPSEISNDVQVSRSKVESVLDYLQQLGVLQAKSESFIDHYIDNVASSLKQPGRAFYEISMPVVLIGDESLSQRIKAQLTRLVSVEVVHDTALFSEIEQSGDNWLFDAFEQEKLIDKFKSWQGKFLIFSTRHINPIIATRLNRIAYELNIPWLHLAMDGPFLFIGPCFSGKQAPCYDCFETRISMNLRESENYQRYKNAILLKQVYTSHEDPLCEVTSNVLIAHGMLEILNYLTTQCTFTANKVLSIFLPTMEFVYHELLSLPACRTCGSIPYRDDTQVYFDFQKLIQEDA
jgi:bacteriocin biosynthesis cyclodehydratase domain-containing protein